MSEQNPRNTALRVDGELDTNISDDPLRFALASFNTARSIGELHATSPVADAYNLLDASRRVAIVMRPETFPDVYREAVRPLALAARHLVLSGHHLLSEQARSVVEAVTHLLSETSPHETKIYAPLLEARAIAYRFSGLENTAVYFSNLQQAFADLLLAIDAHRSKSNVMGEAQANLELAETLGIYAFHLNNREDAPEFQEAFDFVSFVRNQTDTSPNPDTNPVTVIERATTCAQHAASTLAPTHDPIGHARCLIIQAGLRLEHPDHHPEESSSAALQLADKSIHMLSHSAPPYVLACAYQVKAHALQATDPEAATRAANASTALLAKTRMLPILGHEVSE